MVSVVILERLFLLGTPLFFSFGFLPIFFTWLGVSLKLFINEYLKENWMGKYLFKNYLGVSITRDFH